MTDAWKIKHGLTGTPEHDIWCDMRKRCRSHPDYGGRGIRVVKRWDDFAAFLRDMGPRPSREHSVERRNVNGHYSPKNCYWATRAQQQANKRTTRHITFQGKTMHLAGWAREVGLDPKALEYRLNKAGWSVAKALTTPHRGWPSRG
jgi:hypothetical protein